MRASRGQGGAFGGRTRAGDLIRSRDATGARRAIASAAAALRMIPSGAAPTRREIACAAPARRAIACVAATRRAVACAAVAMFLGLSACSSRPIVHEATLARSAALPLDGEYEVTIHTPLFGSISGRMLAQASPGGGFHANTRPGVAWSMIGGIQGALGPLVQPDLFPSGTIVTWTADEPRSGGPSPDYPPGEQATLPNSRTASEPASAGAAVARASASMNALTGRREPADADKISTGPGAAGSPPEPAGSTLPGSIGYLLAGGILRIETVQLAPQTPLELWLGDRKIGVMTVRPAPTAPEPDYRWLPPAVRATLAEHLFDSRDAVGRQLDAYTARLDANAQLARDDIEMAFGAEVARRGTLRFSNVGLLRAPDAADVPLVNASAARASVARLSGLGLPPGVVRVTVDWFAAPEDVDALMTEAAKQSTRGMILDLSTCFGGSLAALRVLHHVGVAPIDVGYVYRSTLPPNPDWTRAAKADAGPSTAGPGVAAPAPLTLNADTTPTDLREQVAASGPTLLRVAPSAAPYLGPLVVITTRRTGGPAEALTAALKASGRATIVGENTGGRMLIAERFPIGKGWLLQVPVLDFCQPDGTRVEGVGVRPDRRVRSAQATETALLLIEQWHQNRAGGQPGADPSPVGHDQ